MLLLLLQPKYPYADNVAHCDIEVGSVVTQRNELLGGDSECDALVCTYVVVRMLMETRTSTPTKLALQ